MVKKVYFAGAIVGDETYVNSQEKIINLLHNGTGTEGLESDIHIYSERSPDYRPLETVEETEEDIFLRDHHWLTDSDLIIAEVSGESFGTGWEIAFAQKVQRIPVLCLCHEDENWPSLIRGNTHKRLWLGQYKDKQDLEAIFQEFFATVTYRDTFPPEERLEYIIQPPLDEKLSVTEELLIGNIEKYNLEGIALLNSKHSEIYNMSKAQIKDLFKGSIEIKDSSSTTRLFRGVIKTITSAGRGVMLAEASNPSTDLGWATCFAQWNNVQPVLFYNDEVEVSWLLTGQTEYAHGGEQAISQLDIPWAPPEFEPRKNPQHGTRPGAIPISYADRDRLNSKLEDIFKKIDTFYEKREERDHSQRYISAYSDCTDSHNSNNEAKEDLIIISESLIRNALWPNVTVKGIENTFLSGERAKLIMFLVDQEPLPNPKQYYRNIQHYINYEEKAFNKNIRALKDIGILYKQGLKISLKKSTLQKTLSDFNSTDDLTNNDEPSLSNTYRSSFTNEEIVLTSFGRALARYLRNHSIDILEEFLQAHSPQLRMKDHIMALEEEIEGYDEYLIDKLPKKQKRVVTALVEANYWLLDRDDWY